jgi:hypothetical protein
MIKPGGIEHSSIDLQRLKIQQTTSVRFPPAAPSLCGRVLCEAKNSKKSAFYNVFLQHTRAKIIEPGVRFPISSA